jgi:hypothetical protein
MRTIEAPFRVLPVMQNLTHLQQILNLKISIVPSHPPQG